MDALRARFADVIDQLESDEDKEEDNDGDTDPGPGPAVQPR